jgi:hypothetical protein
LFSASFEAPNRNSPACKYTITGNPPPPPLLFFAALARVAAWGDGV